MQFVLKNPCDVIQIQLSTISVNHLYSRPFSVQKYSHRTSSYIENKAVRATETAIRESVNRNVSWKIEEKRSAVINRCVQLPSDKSHVSLRAGALVLYPLLVTLLNVSE